MLQGLVVILMKPYKRNDKIALLFLWCRWGDCLSPSRLTGLRILLFAKMLQPSAQSRLNPLDKASPYGASRPNNILYL